MASHCMQTCDPVVENVVGTNWHPNKGVGGKGEHVYDGTLQTIKP